MLNKLFFLLFYIINSPCDIIGSIVNVCPGFITPTALFSISLKLFNLLN